MLERFAVVLGQVATLFLQIGVGFVLARLGMISQQGTKDMTALLINVVSPCVIIGAFPSARDPETLRMLGTAALVLGLCYVLYALAGQLFFRREPRETGAPLRFGCIYNNAGFMGIPLVRAVLGEGATIYAAIAVAGVNIMAFTHGAALMGGKEAFSPRKAVLNPGVIGVAAALALYLPGISLPGPVHRAVGFLADLNTPLAMVVSGAQLARTDLLGAFRQPKLYEASAVKLLVMPVLTALVLLPFRLDPALYVAAVILGGAPSAGYTSMFAERYGLDTGLAAQLVSFCTLLSAATLPLMAVLAEVLQ